MNRRPSFLLLLMSAFHPDFPRPARVHAEPPLGQVQTVGADIAHIAPGKRLE